MARRPETRLAYSTGGEGATSPPEPTAAPKPRPEGAGIRLHLERRASGRMVTVVTGLPGAEAQVVELARRLKIACGAGGTVRGGALELQGDHRDRVEAVLCEKGLRFKRAGRK